MKTLLLVLCNSISLFSFSQIKWDFTTANPSSGVPLNLTASAITAQNNLGNPTLIGNLTASAGYSGASAGNNGQASIQVSGAVINLNTDAYFQVTLTPGNGFQVNITSITFGTRATGTGPVAFAVYQFVGATGTLIFSGAITNNSTWSLKSSGALNNTIALNTPVNIRVYGHNGIASSGTANFKMDDLSITAIANAVMPLTLIDFYGETNKYPVLNWRTADEINVKEFSIERSNDADHFSSIAMIKAKNNLVNEYVYTDFENRGNYYRLKMIDNNGSYTYSKIIRPGAKQTGDKMYKLMGKPILRFIRNSNSMLFIYDSNGRLQMQQHMNKNEIDISGLAKKQVYFVVKRDGTTNRKFNFLND
jgi:hypothetical protein